MKKEDKFEVTPVGCTYVVRGKLKKLPGDNQRLDILRFLYLRSRTNPAGFRDIAKSLPDTTPALLTAMVRSGAIRKVRGNKYDTVATRNNN